jgi:hypothetical protein
MVQCKCAPEPEYWKEILPVRSGKMGTRLKISRQFINHWSSELRAEPIEGILAARSQNFNCYVDKTRMDLPDSTTICTRTNIILIPNLFVKHPFAARFLAAKPTNDPLNSKTIALLHCFSINAPRGTKFRTTQQASNLEDKNL